MPRVRIDPELCIGSQECSRIAPGAFRLDKGRGISEPTERARTTDAALLADAVRSCPTQAISVETDE
jgi:ferredoxin